MIKGVNKQIVEINYTKNDYIEKAILIINPNKSCLPKAIITQKADDYMKTIMNKKSDPERVLPQHRKQKKQTISKPVMILSILLLLMLILLIVSTVGAYL